ncbi:MAG: hypothetical protein J5774_00600 [Clostridia bacterium]|nr:hypothetical protein [Clostridia bacterium]
MVTIDPKKAIKDFVIRSMKFEKYKKLIYDLLKTDVSTNADYQKNFNGFFKVRKNKDWQKEFYSLFESVKTKRLTFADIITEIYRRTGTVETSFSSKMLATINPNMPICDQFVLKNLGLKLTETDPEEKLKKAIALYDQIQKWYAAYLKTDNAKECLKFFDDNFADYKWMTDVKKIDFFLWNIREDEE